MNQLIAIQTSSFSNEVKQTVNARELHSFLEVATRFNDWIVARISDFDFVENQDFVTFTENSVKGRPSKEYALTLDMAKELSMVERNEKGKQARQYFIDCERRAKAVDPMTLLSDPHAMRGLLLNYVEKNLQLESKVVTLAPKAAIADRLAGAEGNLNIRNAAKALKMKEHKFTEWLQIKKYAYRDKKGKLTGYADHVPRYLDHKVQSIPTDGDPDRVSLQLMVTPAGLVRFANVLNVELGAEQDLFQEAA